MSGEPRAEEDRRERGAVREEVGGVKGVEADVWVCELEVCLGVARDEDGEVGAREVDERDGVDERDDEDGGDGPAQVRGEAVAVWLLVAQWDVVN